MNIKKQADSYVEMFIPFVDNDKGTFLNETENATHCAIIHVEGLIKHNAKPDEYYWKEILTELKSRI